MSLNDSITTTAINSGKCEEFTYELLDKLDTFANEVEFRCITIILANGLDLINIDLTKVSELYYFISNSDIPRGRFYAVVDEEIKRSLYKFIKCHPDRVFRGEAGYDEEESSDKY